MSEAARASWFVIDDTLERGHWEKDENGRRYWRGPTPQPGRRYVLKAGHTTPPLPTPTEIIDQRATGVIDDEEMMNALLSRGYSSGKHDPTGGDGYIRGSWSEIERALGKGLLSDEEYERIARETWARQERKP